MKRITALVLAMLMIMGSMVVSSAAGTAVGRCDDMEGYTDATPNSGNGAAADNYKQFGTGGGGVAAVKLDDGNTVIRHRGKKGSESSIKVLNVFSAAPSANDVGKTWIISLKIYPTNGTVYKGTDSSVKLNGTEKASSSGAYFTIRMAGPSDQKYMHRSGTDSILKAQGGIPEVKAEWNTWTAISFEYTIQSDYLDNGKTGNQENTLVNALRIMHKKIDLNGTKSDGFAETYYIDDLTVKEKPVHTHTYDQMKSDDTNHWYECECGTADESTKASHAYTADKSDATSTWKECVCGAKDSVAQITPVGRNDDMESYADQQEFKFKTGANYSPFGGTGKGTVRAVRFGDDNTVIRLSPREDKLKTLKISNLFTVLPAAPDAGKEMLITLKIYPDRSTVYDGAKTDKKFTSAALAEKSAGAYFTVQMAGADGDEYKYRSGTPDILGGVPKFLLPWNEWTEIRFVYTIDEKYLNSVTEGKNTLVDAFRIYQTQVDMNGTPTEGFAQIFYIDDLSVTENTCTDHTYTGWTYDQNNHWHLCGCGYICDYAPHTPGDWITDTEPTETVPGLRHKECTVCGLTTAAEPIPAAGTDTPSDPEEPADTDRLQLIAMLLSMKITLKAEAGEGGAISAEGEQRIRIGASKTYTVTPDEGYEIDYVLVDGQNVGAVSEYTFKSVSRAHSISAVFKKIPQTVPTPVGDPTAPITRGAFMTVLARAAAIDPAVWMHDDIFTDVESGTEEAAAINWAAQNAVTGGKGDGTFGAADPLTAEQAAVFLARFAHYSGMVLPQGGMLENAEKISPWAAEAMAWAISTGILPRTAADEPQAVLSAAGVSAMMANWTLYAAREPIPEVTEEETPAEPTVIRLDDMENYAENQEFKANQTPCHNYGAFGGIGKGTVRAILKDGNTVLRLSPREDPLKSLKVNNLFGKPLTAEDVGKTYRISFKLYPDRGTVYKNKSTEEKFTADALTNRSEGAYFTVQMAGNDDQRYKYRAGDSGILEKQGGTPQFLLPWNTWTEVSFLYMVEADQLDNGSAEKQANPLVNALRIMQTQININGTAAAGFTQMYYLDDLTVTAQP